MDIASPHNTPGSHADFLAVSVENPGQTSLHSSLRVRRIGARRVLQQHRLAHRLPPKVIA